MLRPDISTRPCQALPRAGQQLPPSLTLLLVIADTVEDWREAGLVMPSSFVAEDPAFVCERSGHMHGSCRSRRRQRDGHKFV